ncbi:MAG: hypothetical protein KBF88_11735 [Polyangiaceae bacterium]|nr:hypothetical protein [Polyangiaceae bacterium]
MKTTSFRFPLVSSLSLLSLSLAASMIGCEQDVVLEKPDGNLSDSSLDSAVNEETSAEAGSCVVPATATYNGTNFLAGSAAARGLNDRYNAFTQKMRDAEASAALVPTLDELKALFSSSGDAGAGASDAGDAGDAGAAGSDPRFATSPYYAQKIDGWIAEFAAAAGKTWSPAEPPPANGGIYGAYIFNARGVDLRQAIQNGMLGATQYYSAASRLSSASLSVADVDYVLALYGASPEFPMNDRPIAQEGGVTNPDVFTARYTKRRDAGDLAKPGLYQKLKRSFISLQYSFSNPGCESVRAESIAAIKRDWEKALYATATFYLNDALKKLSTNAPTPADLAAGLHSYGEAVGLIHGFRDLPPGMAHVKTAEVDELLTLLGANPAEAITSYKLITDSATPLAKLPVAVDRIRQIQSFSTEEIESFKVNR